MDNRPDPDQLLEAIVSKAHHEEKGKLKIFLAYAAGVGKTYAMLDEAHEQLKLGKDVVVGYIEPHTRPETTALLKGLPAIAPMKVRYKNMMLNEFDLQSAIKRKPEIILVDELAHTNIESCRNRKRYQDIEELLDNGIDVYTTVNIQHIESLNDIVEELTHVVVRETVPNYIFDHAEMIKLVDIEPEELLSRLREGKIYKSDRVESAMQNFFSLNNLRLLRELALRKATDRVSSVNSRISSDKENKLSSKYLVCISSAPSSAKCIRWTARMAENLHSEFIALHVETSDSAYYSQKQHDDLRLNMELAARLGAQIVTISGESIADAIVEYVQVSGIHNIVIGRNKKSSLLSLLKRNLEDVLISRFEDVEVHIVADSETKGKLKPHGLYSFKKGLQFSWVDTLKTIGLMVVATLLCKALTIIEIDDHNVIMVYLLSVLIISRVTRGFFYGITGAIISVLAFNFFFVEPVYTFSVTGASYPVTFAIMLIVALITSTLINRIKLQAKQSAFREKRTEILYEINKKLLKTRGLENIVELIMDYIVNVFGKSVIFYFDKPEKENSFSVKQAPSDDIVDFLEERNERAVANWVYMNKKRAGCGTDTLAAAKAFYMPILSQNHIVGVIGLSQLSGEKLNHDSRAFLRMISTLVAMAIERQNLSDEQKKIAIEAEKDTMRSNLLLAISHDLRSPLTSILGASSVLMEDGIKMDEPTKNQLLKNIQSDAGWLIRMVENLLSVTKISDGNINLNKVSEAVEEIVEEAVVRVKGKYKDCNLFVQVPEELLIIPMDGTLIEQVIINLLENAILHSGNRDISVTIEKQIDGVEFTVSDKGRGIPEDDLEGIFDGYFTSGQPTADSTRGLGIGLSICKAIVNAHGGYIYAQNLKPCGAKFSFVLPME